MEDELLHLKGIKKSFFGVKALDGVDLHVNKGEVLAVVGENGAGKSTMMKIIAGVYQPDGGEVFVQGKSVTIENTKHSQELGISIIHQEFNLIPYLSVAENIYLGREPMKVGGLVVDKKKMFENTKTLLERVGLNIDPSNLIKTLNVAEQQMVEIAKSLSFNSKVIIMDEPTAALNNEETNNLFDIIKDFKAQGVSVIYISHRLEEIFEVTDSVMILRDGQFITRLNTADTDKDSIVTHMVGRDLSEYFPDLSPKQEKVKLKVNQLTLENKVNDVSFKVNEGEILGVAGLMGSGRSELAKALFGSSSIVSGSIELDGKDIKIKNSGNAIKQGIALVSDDRKQEGLILSMSINNNIPLANMDAVIRSFFINQQKQKEMVERSVKALNIKASSLDLNVEVLSGGNQQKVVLAKWLETNPKLLILNEPTRGIDVGAKTEIYQLMKELAAEGVSILLISSELPELIGMSHRIIVMHEGKLTGDFDRSEFSQEMIMNCATGGAGVGMA